MRRRLLFLGSREEEVKNNSFFLQCVSFVGVECRFDIAIAAAAVKDTALCYAVVAKGKSKMQAQSRASNSPIRRCRPSFDRSKVAFAFLLYGLFRSSPSTLLDTRCLRQQGALQLPERKRPDEQRASAQRPQEEGYKEREREREREERERKKKKVLALLRLGFTIAINRCFATSHLASFSAASPSSPRA